MNSIQIEIQIIVSLVSIACAIPGVFLVLRKMSLISDAISHSILPGIVIGFFITHDIYSPILIVLAALFCILTVVLVEFIQKTGLVKKDTAIGLVFPSLFSLGVILIAQYASDTHLDIDAVLTGDASYSVIDHLFISGYDLGPKSIWVIGTILLITILLLFTFFKELKISTFDVGLAASLGFSPILIHYGLMSISSITIVGAFDIVGSVLVIALMIVPAASAYLLTKDLKLMLILACLFGVFSAISGYWIAHLLDSSISGAITTVLGLIFLGIYLFANKTGMIAAWYKRKQQQTEVMLLTFLLHIKNHQEESERHVNHLNEHINWQKVKSKHVLKLALENNLINISKNIVTLTEKGNDFTTNAINYIIDNKKEDIESMKDDFFLFRG